MEELRTRDSLDLLTQQQKITILENKVRQLSVLEKDQIPFKSLTEEININYENVEEIAYSKVVKSNFKTIDTLSVFEVKWNDSLVNNNQAEKEKAKLYKWLKFKLDVDTLVIRRVN